MRTRAKTLASPARCEHSRAFSPVQITGRSGDGDPTVGAVTLALAPTFLDNPRLVFLRQHRRPRVMNIAETKPLRLPIEQLLAALPGRGVFTRLVVHHSGFDSLAMVG
jgi:hypothetical protein